jgi:hypothetical protein
MELSRKQVGERRFWRLSPAAALLAGIVVVSGFSFAGQAPRLVASTSACQILRADRSTSPPRPGRYTIVVKDTSRTRYFAMSGRNVKRTTSASFVGTRSWTVHLAKGTYRFRCGAAKRLNGVLTVA